MSILQVVRQIFDEKIAGLRIGYHVARVNAAASRFSVSSRLYRGQASVAQIQSPMIDAKPKIGQRVAIVSENGGPSFGAIIGVVWDENNNASTMQAWLRSDENVAPGVTELGATRLLRIKVGENNLTFSADDLPESLTDASVTLQPGRILLKALDLRIEGVNVTVNGRHILPSGGDI
jgi:hypothetical protein